MRISDWSSDVCSSDLRDKGDRAAEIGLADLPLDRVVGHHRKLRVDEGEEQDGREAIDEGGQLRGGDAIFGGEIAGIERRDDPDGEQRLRQAMGEQDRKSVVEGKRVSVAEDSGGRRNKKKKKK